MTWISETGGDDTILDIIIPAGPDRIEIQELIFSFDKVPDIGTKTTISANAGADQLFQVYSDVGEKTYRFKFDEDDKEPIRANIGLDTRVRIEPAGVGIAATMNVRFKTRGGLEEQ